MEKRKETLKEAGYQYIAFMRTGGHKLLNLESGKLEIWFSNKNHAGYGLIFKNTHLEFVREAGIMDSEGETNRGYF